MSELARKYEMDICIGTFVEKVVERDAGEGEQDGEEAEGEGKEKTYNTYVCVWCTGLLVTRKCRMSWTNAW